jgi:hypothetical protein
MNIYKSSGEKAPAVPPTSPQDPGYSDTAQPTKRVLDWFDFGVLISKHELHP